MTFKEAIGVLVGAAEARQQQWQGLVDMKENHAAVDAEAVSPADLIPELWEVWGNMDLDDENTEAQDLVNAYAEAIKVVQRCGY